MAVQLPLDFSRTAANRRRTKVVDLEQQPVLFDADIDVDIHLHSPREAIAHIAGPDPEFAAAWLERIVGPTKQPRRRRVVFASSKLDRLLSVVPPAHVTLDASATAVARALWARRLGLRPLRVTRRAQRLLASSPRWPTGFKVADAPWPAIATLAALDVPLEVEPRARGLVTDRLARDGETIAKAGLAGTAVVIETDRPEWLVSLELPALAFYGAADSGRFRMPLLAAACLLDEPAIEVSPDLDSAIRRSMKRPRPLASLPGFPWDLFSFQARDVARGLRILETTGGVLYAGDMGAGKTIMALATITHLDAWPLLVVCPLAAMSTWDRQLRKLGRTTYLATDIPKVAFDRIASGVDEVVVLSYDRLHAFVELIERLGFRAIVADEIQRIRTPSSRRSRALRQLAHSSPLRIGLSGTPITNRVEELLPLGSFLVPGEWKPRASTRELSSVYPGDPLVSISDHLVTMMVRRRMEDTGVKLPHRHDHRVMVPLTPEQRRALADLEAEARAAKADKGFSHLHAFVRLQRMRAIINCPSISSVAGPNPKLLAAMDLVEDFLEADRKGVVFCADRQMFKELTTALSKAGIGHVGIWGSTPVADRIENERRFHEEESIKVVVATIQAASEAVSFSPTASFLISTSYMYSPAMLDQMEARIYRLNQTNDVDICYLHAQTPGGTLDDRMLEILAEKRRLIDRVVDKRDWSDTTKVHYSLSDLVYLLTGKHDDALETQEADRRSELDREQQRKRHTRASAHRHKTGEWEDDGLIALTREDLDAELDVELDAPMLESLEAVLDGVAPDDDFDDDAELTTQN